MGRSRITRTFHNKPVSKAKNLPSKNIPSKSRSVTKVTRQVASSSKPKPKSKELIPQAHAQESGPIPVNPQGKYGTIDSTEDQIIGEKWGSFGFTINKTGKARGRNVKIRESTRGDGVADTTVTSKYTDLDTEKFTKERTILGKFAQGVGNEAQDIGGVPYGLVTGQDYKTKSILSKATEHAFKGDWDSAGKVISDNPYRFAGNVATNIGLSVIPFGIAARGAGLAGKAGGAISKGLSKGGSKGKKLAMKATGKLKGKGATVPGRSGPIKSASSHVVDSQGNWVNRPASWPLRSTDKATGKLKGKGAEKKSYAGGGYTKKEINDAERLIQKSGKVGKAKSKVSKQARKKIGLGFTLKFHKKKGAVSRYKNRKEQRFEDIEMAMERRIDDFAGRSTGTPKWYQPREQFLDKTKGSRARLSRDQQNVGKGFDEYYGWNSRIRDTKPKWSS